MIPNDERRREERLTLGVQLADLARLQPWIERLASRYVIPEEVQFASNLCLEEVLSNIIVHGHNGKNGGAIVVRFFRHGDGGFLFVVDDEAPRFNPLEQPELPALDPGGEMRIGGWGLRLVRHFADRLEYESTPTGNRLTMAFSRGTLPSA